MKITLKGKCPVTTLNTWKEISVLYEFTHPHLECKTVVLACHHFSDCALHILYWLQYKDDCNHKHQVVSQNMSD